MLRSADRAKGRPGGWRFPFPPQTLKTNGGAEPTESGGATLAIMPALSNFLRLQLLCPSGAGASGVCAASAPRITPFVAPCATRFPSFVAPCAPFSTPLHPARLGLGI